LIEHLLSRTEANSKESYDFCGFPFYISDQLIKYKQALDRESKMKQNPPQAESEQSAAEAPASM